jgi:hypothetical protein
LPDGLLPPFRFDQDWRVRFEAAQRVPAEYLAELANDEDEAVATAARERMNPNLKENTHG